MGDLEEADSLLPPEGPGAQTQVIRLGAKYMFVKARGPWMLLFQPYLLFL